MVEDTVTNERVNNALTKNGEISKLKIIKSIRMISYIVLCYMLDGGKNEEKLHLISNSEAVTAHL